MNNPLEKVNSGHALKEVTKQTIMKRIADQNVDIYIRKELSMVTRLGIFGVYTVIIFSLGLLTFSLFNNSSSSGNQHIEKIQNDIKNIFMKEKNDNALSYNLYQDQLARKFEENLIKIISQEKELSREIIKNKDVEINQLQEKNDLLKKQVEMLINGNNAINKFTNSEKNIPYTEANLSLLIKKQNLMENELEKSIKQREEVFVSSHNMSDPKDIELFNKLKQAGVLELFELKEKHRQQKKDFKENKFLK